MAGARAVAAAATYMGLVEVGVGLIPAAGGCKELVRRLVSPPMHRYRTQTRCRFCNRRLQTIATAKVSSSAMEARQLGFLTEADWIVMNRDFQIGEAKKVVLEMSEAGYVAPRG